MNHFHFNTEDLRWAICIAGVVNSAKSEKYSKVNPKFTVSFEPTTPEIKHLSSWFYAKPKDYITYKFPEEEHYPGIDLFAAKNQAKYLEDQHGIKQQELRVVPLALGSLISNSLLLTHGILSDPGYFYPAFQPKQLRDTPYYDVIIESEKYRKIAMAFCEGFGLLDPKVITTEEVSTLEALKLLCNDCKVFVSRPTHPLQYFLRSQYTGYDNLKNDVISLGIYDSSSEPFNRYGVQWPGQILIMRDQPLSVVTNQGQAHAIKVKYNFDHRKMIKDIVKNVRT